MVRRVRNARWPRLAPAAGLLAALALAPRDARAGDPAAARELLKRGYVLAEDGRCADAAPLYEESVRLDPKAITFINLADCEEKLGRLGSALGHWVDARARAKIEANAAIEAEAEQRAKALEPRLARLTLVLPRDAPEGTTVVRDGLPLGAASLGLETPVDPGTHTLVVRAPGRAESSTSVALGEGERKRVELAVGATVASREAPPAREEARRSPASSPATSPLVWIGFGLGAAGLATGAVTGLVAMGRARDLERACPDRACPDAATLDDVSSGRALGNVSTIAFVLGGAGLALGTVALVLDRRSAPLRVVAGPGGASVAGSF